MIEKSVSEQDYDYEALVKESTQTNGYDIPLDYEEPQVIRDVEAHTLRILDVVPRIVVRKDTGNETEVIDVLLKVVDDGHENAKLIVHTLWMPSESDSKTAQNTAIGKMLKFAKAAEFEAKTVSEFKSNIASAKGKDVVATLRVKNEDEYGDKNLIRRFLV